jgi:signal transduction histidine kinase
LQASDRVDEDSLIGVGEINALRTLEVELEKARQVRQRFLWSFSHELRTPLNVILCYNDLIASEILGPLTEKQEQATTRISASIVQLKQLIEGVFELNEIESRGIAVAAEPVELRALADSIAEELSPLATAKGLYLEVEGSTKEAPITDGPKVRRIIVNLCANALRLTAEGGVTIRIMTESARARIDVIDTGHGLDETEREQIFEEFAQVGPEQRHTGLNLVLAHRLAILLGAEITVTSRKGHGTNFSLLLPMTAKVAAGG